MKRRKFLQHTAWFAALTTISPGIWASSALYRCELATLPAAQQQIRHGLLQAQAPLRIFKQCSWLHKIETNQFQPIGLSKAEQMLTHYHVELDGVQFQLGLEGQHLWLTSNLDEQVIKVEIPAVYELQGYTLQLAKLAFGQAFEPNLGGSEWVVLPLRGSLQQDHRSLAKGQALFAKAPVPQLRALDDTQLLLIVKG